MRHVLRLATAATILCAGAASASAEELVLASYGGSFGEAVKACHVAAFEKATGATVSVKLNNSSQTAAALRATAALTRSRAAGLVSAAAIRGVMRRVTGGDVGITPSPAADASRRGDLSPSRGRGGGDWDSPTAFGVARPANTSPPRGGEVAEGRGSVRGG